MRVFWSWQNDTDTKINHYLIQEAIKQALNDIASELNLDEADRPELDQDTKGVAGAVEIAQTILKKIDGASAFIADVTPVGETSKGKKLPNPNVLVELGFALKSPGHEKVILVLNTALGAKPEDLPFDLRGRRCMTYSCPPNASKAVKMKAQQQLADDLTNALKSNLESKSDFDFKDIRTLASDDGSIWKGGDREIQCTAAFPGDPSQRYTLRPGPRAYMRIVPASWPNGSPSVPDYGALDRNQRVGVATSGSTKGSWGATSNGFIDFWFTGQEGSGEITGVTQYFEQSGEVWSVWTPSQYSSPGTLGLVPILQHWDQSLRSSLAFFELFEAANLRFLEVGLVGADGFQMAAGFPSERRDFRRGHMAISHKDRQWTAENCDRILTDAFNMLRGLVQLPKIESAELNEYLNR